MQGDCRFKNKLRENLSVSAPKAQCHQKTTDSSAHYDLFPARNIVLKPHSTQRLETDTDIGLCFSKRFSAKIYSHSGLSSRSIEYGVGVIDSVFRGSVLHNLSDRQVEFKTGDRIAQVAFQKVKYPTIVEGSNFNDSVTKRNEQGFDSTEAREKLKK